MIPVKELYTVYCTVEKRPQTKVCLKFGLFNALNCQNQRVKRQLFSIAGNSHIFVKSD